MKYVPKDKAAQASRVFGAGIKSVTKKIGEGLAAMAEEAQRQAELEKAERGKVEQAMREYEATTGRPYQRPEKVYGSVLPWEPRHPGHLVNCSPSCNTHHCLVCGDRSWAEGTYCLAHRP